MTEISPTYLTVRQFAQKHPAFPEGGLRYLIFHEKKLGLNSAITRLGRKVLIDEAAFLNWVKNYNEMCEMRS